VEIEDDGEVDISCFFEETFGWIQTHLDGGRYAMLHCPKSLMTLPGTFSSIVKWYCCLFIDFCFFLLSSLEGSEQIVCHCGELSDASQPNTV
jgi:hypothetical protein